MAATDKNYIALFDLDHTILNDSSGKILALQALKKDILKRRDIMEGLFLSFLYKLGLMDGDKILARMSQWMHGMSEKWINNFIDEMMNMAMKPAIRDNALREIEYHLKNNALTVILSASVTHICKPIQDHLGMDDIICSTLEVSNGKFTGTTVGPYCYGIEKLNRAFDYCKNHGFALDNAWFYTDSVSDLPMLEAVGNPICVTPDRKLQNIAREKGWPINWW